MTPPSGAGTGIKKPAPLSKLFRDQAPSTKSFSFSATSYSLRHEILVLCNLGPLIPIYFRCRYTLVLALPLLQFACLSPVHFHLRCRLAEHLGTRPMSTRRSRHRRWARPFAAAGGEWRRAVAWVQNVTTLTTSGVVSLAVHGN